MNLREVMCDRRRAMRSHDERQMERPQGNYQEGDICETLVTYFNTQTHLRTLTSTHPVPSPDARKLKLRSISTRRQTHTLTRTRASLPQHTQIDNNHSKYKYFSI